MRTPSQYLNGANNTWTGYICSFYDGNNITHGGSSETNNYGDVLLVKI